MACFWPVAWTVVLTLKSSCTFSAAELADRTQAQQKAQKLWDMYGPIQDLQLKSQSDRWAPGEPEGPGTRRWRDGFYAYKQDGYEYLRYIEWNARERRNIRFVYAKTPDELRGMYEDIQYGYRNGGIRKPMTLNFRVYCSPGELLLVPRIHEQTKRSFMGGGYVIYMPEGPEKDVQLIYPAWPKPKKEDARERRRKLWHNVLTLSPRHDYAPVRFQYFLEGKLVSEWELSLFKFEKGLWLAQEVKGRQTPNEAWPKGLEFELKVDALSVRINAGLKPDFFTFEFPPGTRVFNQITMERYTVGMDDADARKRLAAMAARAEELAGPPRPLRPSRARWTSTDWLVAATTVLLAAMFVAGAALALRRGKG